MKKKILAVAAAVVLLAACFFIYRIWNARKAASSAVEAYNAAAQEYNDAISPYNEAAAGIADENTKLQTALDSIPMRVPLTETPPVLPAPEQVCSIRQAMFSPRETLPVDQAVGRIFADACISCPPAVPVVIAGERITEQAAVCMKSFGITVCETVKGV